MYKRQVLSGRVASLCWLVVSKRSEKVLMMNGTTCGSYGSCGATILYDDVSVNLNCLVAQVFSGCDQRQNDATRECEKSHSAHQFANSLPENKCFSSAI